MQVQEIEFYGPEQVLPVFTDLTTSSAGSVTGYSTVYANKNYNGNKAFDNAKNLSDDGSRCKSHPHRPIGPLGHRAITGPAGNAAASAATAIVNPAQGRGFVI